METLFGVLIAVGIILYLLFCGITAFKLMDKHCSPSDAEILMLLLVVSGLWVPFIPFFKFFDWLSDKFIGE